MLASMPRAPSPSFLDRLVDRAVLAVGRVLVLAFKRAAAEAPKIARKLMSAELPLTVSGKAGGTKPVQIYPEEWFQGEKLIAFEMGDGAEMLDGTNTIITGMFVGAQNMGSVAVTNSGEHGQYTKVYAHNSLGNGFSHWTPCRLGQSITLHIKFLKDCTWHGIIFGQFDRSGTVR